MTLDIQFFLFELFVCFPERRWHFSLVVELHLYLKYPQRRRLMKLPTKKRKSSTTCSTVMALRSNLCFSALVLSCEPAIAQIVVNLFFRWKSNEFFFLLLNLTSQFGDYLHTFRLSQFYFLNTALNFEIKSGCDLSQAETRSWSERKLCLWKCDKNNLKRNVSNKLRSDY